MTKIVYNACFGGFSLSEAAIRRYADIKGLTLYPEKGDFSFVTMWTIPEAEREGKTLSQAAWHKASIEERQASNKFSSDNQLYDRDIPRSDPALVQVVEELGAAANGMFAKLCIAEVPAGGRYRIDEYDGSETVVQPDDQDWSIA